MLKVKNITKIYTNGTEKSIGCKDISFNVKSGQIVSLLGLNGAGKSSILKILSTYMKPTSGDAYINNLSIIHQSENVKGSIGVLYEKNPLYHNMSVKDFLLFCAKMYKLDMPKSRVDEVCCFWQLEKVKHKLISTLSKGFKQRVGLAAAIIHKPKLLILDEPTSGLDSIQTKEFEKNILKLSKDSAILFSTHNLLQAENLCNKHLLLDKGSIIVQGTLHEIKNQIIQKQSQNSLSDFNNKDLKQTEKEGHVLETAFRIFKNIDLKQLNDKRNRKENE
ncbi:MAG: multidrug ABC transporter ATP-binding protein [Treponema sp.]|nr:MAG: multidrug ABC transporter ATP-binding protein [Treponema sp.]